jgi:acyl-coenzyme A thioesterase PaaI-like protein
MFKNSPQQQQVVIGRRFDGMPGIAHGGYLAGLLAATLDEASAEVRLRRPVPTDRPLTLARAETEAIELRDDKVLFAEGAPAELSLDVPLPVTLAQAERASRRFPGLHTHPFPDCLVCGGARTAGDGLRVFPGPVAGRRLVAASWVPAPELANGVGQVPSELVWAALDCPQLWSLMVHAPAASPDLVVTAALNTRLGNPVLAGEPHVVIGWPIGRNGRGWLAGAAVIRPDGELCAVGRQTAAVTSWGVPLGWQRRMADRTSAA